MKQIPSPHREREAWLEYRRPLITGSKVAALFGEHPFMTAQDVLDEILGVPREVRENGPMRRGAALEDQAADMWAQKTGRRIKRVGLRHHPSHHILAASVDRQVLSERDEESKIIKPTSCLELKVPMSWTLMKWRREGLPRYILWQLQLEAMVWGYSEAHVGVLDVEEWDIEDFVVPASLIAQEQILEKVLPWYERHVINREPLPEQEVGTHVAVDLPEVQPGDLTLVTDEATVAAIRDFARAKELKARAEEIEKSAKSEIAAWMDEAYGEVLMLPVGADEEGPSDELEEKVVHGFGTYEVDGELRLHYKERPGRKTFDKKALQRAKPIDPVAMGAKLAKLIKDGTIEITGHVLEFVDEVVSGVELDLTQFEKQGNPYTELRLFQLKAKGENE